MLTDKGSYIRTRRLDLFVEQKRDDSFPNHLFLFPPLTKFPLP